MHKGVEVHTLLGPKGRATHILNYCMNNARKLPCICTGDLVCLTGDNKETITIVGIHINTENQKRQRSQK
jgi:hypothetical protein